MDAFGPALAGADYVLLTGIYAAGEDPIPGVTIDALAEAIRRSVRGPVEVVPRLEDVVPAILRVARPGDVVITLGAGSIGTVPERLVAALSAGDA
jgi:UDP-N-acetylmuramate--alanine ligase